MIQMISHKEILHKDMKGKTTRKESYCKFLATKEYLEMKSIAQRNRILKLEFSFLLYFCSIHFHQNNDIPF